MAGWLGQEYQIRILHSIDGVDPIDDNVDVEVHFDDGSRYAATFFTLRNLQSLFEKNSRTGECKNGLYLWESDMIIVKELSEPIIAETVAQLLSEGEFKSAFSRIDEEADAGTIS